MDPFTSSKLHSFGSHFYEAYIIILRYFNAIAAYGTNSHFFKN